MTQLSFGAGQVHSHLRLARTLEPLPRRIPPGGGGGKRHYSDHRSHAKDIAGQIAEVRDRHRHREPVLGIDPDLVLVIEFNERVADVAETVERSELRVLGVQGRQALAVFSNDPDLREFWSRCDSYHDELTSVGNPRFLALFDVIDRVRYLEPADVIDDDLAARIATSPDETLRVDFECWCTAEMADTESRHRDVKTVLSNAGVSVLDSTCRFQVGLSIIRADIAAWLVLEVVDTKRISRASLIPRPLFTRPEIVDWQYEQLPTVLPPVANTATVAIIDSGIQAGHPLLAPAVYETLSVVPDFPEGADESGHGTLVGSLALHGPLERLLHRDTAIRPAGKLISIRVLDHEAKFPESALWQKHLEQAVRTAIQVGARVINLSLGDPDHPYRPPAPIGIAAVLDRLAREHDVVLVISSGNVHHEAHTGMDYAARLVHAEEHNLAPPAMSALALTVGALVPDYGQGARPARESAVVRQLGKPGDASPLTRTGPGIEFAIKPELAAPGGSYVHDLDTQQVRREAARGTIVGASGADPERLLALDLGTSVAAPLVSHAALRVLARHPALTANGVRALLLASAQPVANSLEGPTDKKAETAHRLLTGFGRSSAERAELSAEHRAVLLAEQSILPDQVHFYQVHLPTTFCAYGQKSLTVGLAFDPPTRATRLAYLGSRMSVFAYRARPVDEIRAKFAASAGEPPGDLASAKIDLQPSDRDRLLGANQSAHRRWMQGWSPENLDLVIVVRNTNRENDQDRSQTYALAVAVEVDENMPPLYAELRAQFEALAEVEVEIEP